MRLQSQGNDATGVPNYLKGSSVVEVYKLKGVSVKKVATEAHGRERELYDLYHVGALAVEGFEK